MRKRLHHQHDRDDARDVFLRRGAVEVDQPVIEVMRHPEPGGDRDKAQHDLEQSRALAVRHLQEGGGDADRKIDADPFGSISDTPSPEQKVRRPDHTAQQQKCSIDALEKCGHGTS